ncbi:hypothetical protein BN1723_016059 [Verticillium longisporum]|uniref:Uncharacterized protein n=1 Tax=Verticillium longisporum TaxID=100787 RepID=A0A0G4LVC9_VERLO|nr:hypothetical protein HYQ44_019070 [Verticillium longisporum]CRK25937.1 hypothetical protein BN1708_014369 [Verticillium longisporum]CRK42686.1 hypothetical protein BN1723_016059 [Verticillium longisporum]
MSGKHISVSIQQGTSQRPSSNVSNAGTFEESPASNQQGANGGQGYSQNIFFDQGLTDRNTAYQTEKEQESQRGYSGVAKSPQRPVETQEYLEAAERLSPKSKASKSKRS